MSWGLTEADIGGDVVIERSQNIGMPTDVESLLAQNPDVSLVGRNEGARRGETAENAVLVKTEKTSQKKPVTLHGEIKVTLPYPPSANRYWRTCKNRTVVSTEARAYKKQVANLLSHLDEPLHGPVVVSLFVFRPRRSGDLDNRIKVCLDSLNGVAYNDDSQVVEIHAYRYDDKHAPRVEVVIESGEE